MIYYVDMRTHLCEEDRPARTCFGKEFWHRNDVERARRLLDLWASSKRASQSGADGCPTVDTIFERPAGVLGPRLDRRTGLWVVDEELYLRNSTRRALPEPRMAEIQVDGFFQELGTPRLAVSLLYFLYPRTGPYCQDGELKNFRPKALFGSLGGKYLDRARLALMSQLHREAVLQLARAQAGAPDSANAGGTTEDEDFEAQRGAIEPEVVVA